MIAAMVEIVAQEGLADTSVADVVGRSGVSRRTFYEVFADREQCFLAALDDSIDRVAEHVHPAYMAGGCWRERVRAGLIGVLSFLDHEPSVARLLVVESLGGGPSALERRGRVLAQLRDVVDGGRGEAKARRDLPPLLAEGVVGGVLSVIHTRLVEEERPVLIELTGPLMAMVVLPYLGSATAERELVAPIPDPPPRLRPISADPLRGLEMRLTYRTVQVLLALGEHPGASNREVGRAAGIKDQGQVSKLLARLQRLGLLENGGDGQLRGAPNAWTLTARGMEVERAVNSQTTRA
jgi:AcrR family transcriptional regulator